MSTFRDCIVGGNACSPGARIICRRRDGSVRSGAAGDTATNSRSRTVSFSLQEWRNRTIYQLLTDRFGASGSPPCPNLSDYCGGSFQGIIAHLDYIQAMGFDVSACGTEDS